MSKSLFKIGLIGSVIGFVVLVTIFSYLWGFSLFILIPLMIGSALGLVKILMSVKVLEFLTTGNMKAGSIGVLNVVFYLVCWLVFVVLLYVSYRIGNEALWSFISGSLFMPFILVVYGIGWATGLIRANFFKAEKVQLNE